MAHIEPGADAGGAGNRDDAGIAKTPPEAIWFVHAGGLPLAAIGVQLSALELFGATLAHFDHDQVMLGQARRLGVSSFDAYVDALIERAGRAGRPFSALVPTVDLAWLGREKAVIHMLGRPFRFVQLAFRDPVLQAIGLVRDEAAPGAPALAGSADDDFDRIAAAVARLTEREDAARAWIAERGGVPFELTVEDLAAPGVAVLRHLLDDCALALPTSARLRPIDPPSPDDLAVAGWFRTEAEKRHWRHAIPVKNPHWRRQSASCAGRLGR